MEEKCSQVGYSVAEDGAVVVALPKFKIGEIVRYDLNMYFIISIELDVKANGDSITGYRLMKSGSVTNSNSIYSQEKFIGKVEMETLEGKNVAEYHFAKATYEYYLAKYYSEK